MFGFRLFKVFDIVWYGVGHIFAVEICDFSVFTYSFYSSNKYIFVELSFVQRHLQILAENC